MIKNYIVSTHHRFVYVVVPKVACTSIKWALLPLLEDADMPAYDERAREKTPNIHGYLRSQKVQLSREAFQKRYAGGRFEEFFRFGFVRNPWDRLVSCYKSKVAGDHGRPVGMKIGGEKGHFRRGMPFDAFVEIVCRTPDDLADVHFLSQSAILYGSGALEGVLLAGFVGRFESFAQDFARVASAIAPGRALQPGIMNASGAGDGGYRRYYTPAMADAVAERYARDIDAFDYAF